MGGGVGWGGDGGGGGAYYFVERKPHRTQLFSLLTLYTYKSLRCFNKRKQTKKQTNKQTNKQTHEIKSRKQQKFTLWLLLNDGFYFHLSGKDSVV